MQRKPAYMLLVALLTFALAGCQSHQAEIDALQREHDRISEQYKRDCGDQYLKAQPQFSQKCVDEAKQMDDIYKRLQEERAKQ